LKGENLSPEVSIRSLAIQTAALIAKDLRQLVEKAKGLAVERVMEYW
jgi:hypothetical protein